MCIRDSNKPAIKPATDAAKDKTNKRFIISFMSKVSIMSWPELPFHYSEQ